LVDEKRQWFKAHTGIAASETSKEQSFCAHALMKPNDMLQVEDATADERFADNPLVTGPTNIVFYAGIPLVNEDGFPLGTLCVVDHTVKKLTALRTDALNF